VATAESSRHVALLGFNATVRDELAEHLFDEAPHAGHGLVRDPAGAHTAESAREGGAGEGEQSEGET
jgi:hypothetical protein